MINSLHHLALSRATQALLWNKKKPILAPFLRGARNLISIFPTLQPLPAPSAAVAMATAERMPAQWANAASCVPICSYSVFADLFHFPSGARAICRRPPQTNVCCILLGAVCTENRAGGETIQIAEFDCMFLFYSGKGCGCFNRRLPVWCEKIHQESVRLLLG